MTIVIEGVRPEVVSKDLAEELDDYRMFRHLFRHAYAGELRWKKMEHLAANIGELSDMLEKSLKGFREFILIVIAKLGRLVKD